MDCPAVAREEAPTAGGETRRVCAYCHGVWEDHCHQPGRAHACTKPIRDHLWSPARRPAPSRPEDRGERWRVDSEGVYLCPDCQHDEPEIEHWAETDAEDATCEGCGRSSTPLRDPAGEGEEVCRGCGQDVWAVCMEPHPAPVFVHNTNVGCAHHHPLHARPSSPAGEGERCEAVMPGSMAVCGLLPSHEYHDPSACEREDHPPSATCHPYQPPARPSSPTGETPTFEHKQHQYPPSEFEATATGETAGQGVEDAWTRVREWAGPEGVWPYAVWQSPPHDGGRTYNVPLAVEQRLRADAEPALASMVRGLQDQRRRLEARATAAEAERDRLWEELEEKTTLLRVWFEIIDKAHAKQTIGWVRGAYAGFLSRTRRALAGESTGAGEGE